MSHTLSTSLARRHPTPTQPSVVGSLQAQANAASVNITLPTVLAGDVAYVVTNTDPTGTINTPSGWTFIQRRSDTGTKTGLTQATLFRKVLAPGDSGTTVTFARSANSAPIAVAGVVVRGSDPAFNLGFGRNALQLNPKGQTVLFPATRTSPQDLVVCLGVARGYTSTAQAAPRIATPGAGLTVHVNTSVQYPLGFHYAAWALSGQPSVVDEKDASAVLGDQCYMVGLTLVLSPVGQWPTARMPKSLTGKPMRFYTTSAYAYVTGDGNHIAEAPVPARLDRRVLPSTLGWYSLPGAYASDICGFMAGTVAYPTQASSWDTDFVVSQSGGWAPLADKSGLVVVDTMGNDAFNHFGTANGASPAKSLAGARHATESIARILRSDFFVGAGDPLFTYTGTWEFVAANDVLGGGSMRGTPGSTVSFPVSTTADLNLWLLALDDFVLQAQGASYTVAVNSQQVKSGTTSNQMKTATFADYNNSPYCQMPVPLQGSLNGSTVTITVGPSGVLFFTGLTALLGTPPWIVMNRLPVWSTAALASINTTQAAIDMYNQIIEDVAALFTDGRVIVYNPMSSGRWNASTMAGTYDNIHYNDAGMAHFDVETARALSERIP